jgi:CubicO group peptidase (beta-lactamase class C family)
MEPWLQYAMDYVRDWLEFQMRASQQPGCMIAISHRGKVVFEHAFGSANLDTGEKLTPRHRFRIASHSKSFTAAGIMKLRERRRLRLDDPIGQYVTGLHRRVAEATIAQLLSHSAGLTRDGADAGQFVDRRAYLNQKELMADLQRPPVIESGSRLKYSNHGFGLLGLAIETITGEPYRGWIAREIVAATGLRETTPDMPLAKGVPFARGHTPRLPLDRRLVISGDNSAHAMAPAAGFVSTAADVARFFAQLAPNAKRSVLSTASRREMTRKHWRNPHASLEGYYGFGTMSGNTGGWDWFGHTGGFQGYISRTCVVPARELAITILTNSTDGWAGLWLDGAIHILRAFATRGAPNRRVRDWTGRWWSQWGAVDLVPIGNIVIAAVPGAINPFMDTSELEISGRDAGNIRVAAGYGSHGEPIRRIRNKAGAVTDIWLAGSNLKPEKILSAEIARRYAPRKRRLTS